MSPKFIFLTFTTFLLIQSSFGKAVPVESSVNELATTESKEIDSSSEDRDYKFYVELFFKERVFALDAIHDIFEDIKELKEGEDLKQIYHKITNTFKLNILKFVLSLSSEEENHLMNSKIDEVIYPVLFNLYQKPKLIDSEESSESEFLTIEDKKRIFLIQQIANYAYLSYSLNEGDIDEEQYMKRLVDFYKDTAREYYKSFTKEEQEQKKPFMDWLEEQTVESVLEEISEEENYKVFELLSQFFELTDVEKFKVLLFQNSDSTDYVNFLDYYKGQVEKYSNSLPNEKSKLKKSFADHLEKLNNIDDDEEQVKYILSWVITLKDDEEEKQQDS